MDRDSQSVPGGSARGLTIGCRGCGAVHAFSQTKVLRGGPAPLTLGSFYESDCQGRSPPLLIARFLPLQSAPLHSPPRARLRGARGPSEQSSSACVTSSVGSGSDVGIRQALGSHGCEPRFYLRLGCFQSRPDASSGSARGPGVRRVPRQTTPGERLIPAKNSSAAPSVGRCCAR